MQIGICILPHAAPRAKCAVTNEIMLAGRNFSSTLSNVYAISEYVVSNKFCVELPSQNVGAKKMYVISKCTLYPWYVVLKLHCSPEATIITTFQFVLCSSLFSLRFFVAIDVYEQC